MKNYKIKFRLEKWGKTLVFQVLDMDERFRCDSNTSLEYVSSNKLKICSYYSIGLEQSIYLQGYGSHVDDVRTYSFSTNEKMDLYYDKALFALDEWSKNWEGFKDDKSIPNKDGIFNFNDKIKFRLDKYNRNLVFQVLGMDGRFRCVSNIEHAHRTNNGIIICSHKYPQRYCDHIYLWGVTHDNDSELVTMTYSNNYNRDDMYNKILLALKHWSENWKGFKNYIKPKDGIFTF